MWVVGVTQARRRCEGPQVVCLLAALKGHPGRHAWRRAHLQAKNGTVLGDLAHARRCRRSAPRRLRRRHMDSPRLRGADRLQRRVRAVVAPRSLGDEARMAVAALPYRSARHGCGRRRQRFRCDGGRGMAANKGAEMHVPCILRSQKVYNVSS